MVYSPSEKQFSIKEDEGIQILEVDEESKTLTQTLVAQPYVPVAVFKCLTKMALAIMPPHDLPHFRRAIEWIRNPDHRVDTSPHGNLGCYLYSFPNRVPASALLLQRKEPDAPLPYMLFLVSAATMLMQIYVPFCNLDSHLIGKVINVPKYDLSMTPGFRDHR